MSFAARSLADALPYPAAITDDSGRVLVANERWRHSAEGETLSGGRPDCPGHDRLPASVRDARTGSDVALPCRCDPGVTATLRVTGLESTCGARRRLITVETGPAESGRDQLLGLLGPQIRTPAAAVASAVELLRAQALPAAAQETIDEIQRTVRGLEALADDLAELARLETGTPPPHDGPVVLRRLLEDVAESMRAACRERGILLLAAPAPGLPAVVDGDDGVLRRILTTVVGHAVRQSSGGEVVVTAQTDGADAYRIEISGDGEPSSGHTSDERAGLALAGRLAAAMGGTTTMPGVPALIAVPAMTGDAAIRADAFSATGATLTGGPDTTGASVVGGAAPSGAAPSGAGGGGTGSGEVGGGFRWAVRLPLRPLPDRGDPGTSSAPPVRGRVAVTAPSARSTLALSWLVAATGAEPVRVGPDGSAGTGDDRGADPVLRCDARPDPVTGGTVMIGSTGPQRAAGRAGTLSVPVTLDRLTAALHQQHAEPRPTPVTLEPLPPGRVLLAEDDEVNRTVLQRMISVLGVECDTVPDGAAAVTALLSGTRYDLALLDMQMPVMDGPAATRTVRAAGSRVPIIALTATSLSEDQDRCLDAGMNSHLTKPITLPELRRALEPYLTAPAQPAEPAEPADPVVPAVAVPTDVLSRAQLHELEEQLEGRELVAMTVNMFLGELDGRRQAMATALATGGNDRLAAVAHTLKSSSALLGAQPLADACARVERLAATPVDAGVLAAAVSEVDQAAAAAAIAMTEYLKET
ncbi:ATP-binding response regulator [Actinoplanes xinjiangensis]|uniref:ATP-binding response regulator n=1 Tax=Actinoplanes xinjiangensis TaxID=512350 RepID=UPI00342E3E0E